MIGGPFFTIFIVFLILKLTHVIDWSWWLVTCPLWCTLLIVPVVIILLLLGIISGATIFMIMRRFFWVWPRRDY
jgi:hypothetical protein